MERMSLTIEGSSVQPLSPTLIGTITCNALPSLAGIGPVTWPVTDLTPAKRLASAVTLAWSAAVMAPLRSYTTTAGKTSLGVNRLASSTTCVDSAFFGSHADASFFWALLSLPENCIATPNRMTQKAKTPHLDHRPDGTRTILCVQPMTPPQSVIPTAPECYLDPPTGVRCAVCRSSHK